MNKLKRPSEAVIRKALHQLVEANGWEVLWKDGNRKVYKAR